MDKILTRQSFPAAPVMPGAPRPAGEDHQGTIADAFRASAGAATVAILLGTYNGARFLGDQLDSIAAQAYPRWKVWASDDGSQDETLAILNKYQAGWGDQSLAMLRGPGRGFVANFLSLVCDASIQADYYAFADQDDIWEADKLSRAMQWLEQQPKEIPALYCSRTRLVDADNQDVGFSPLFTRAPGFANALVQNVGGGNTMVLNEAARRLLVEAGKDINVVSHDWWAYLVIAGCGGVVHYAPHPTIRYRQHGNNVVGSNNGWFARARRIRLLFKGRFKTWNEQHIQALQQIRHQITPENRKILDQFASARQRSLVPRLIGMKRANIYRQTFLGNVGLVAATFFKKI